MQFERFKDLPTEELKKYYALLLEDLKNRKPIFCDRLSGYLEKYPSTYIYTHPTQEKMHDNLLNCVRTFIEIMNSFDSIFRSIKENMILTDLSILKDQ